MLLKIKEKVTTNPIWWHFLSVTVPDKVTRESGAFIYVEGGSNNNPRFEIGQVLFFKYLKELQERQFVSDGPSQELLDG